MIQTDNITKESIYSFCKAYAEAFEQNDEEYLVSCVDYLKLINIFINNHIQADKLAEEYLKIKKRHE